MSTLKDKYNCCGCGACEAICGHSAIEMMPDPIGFLYPNVDVAKCIECGLCERVCSFKSDYQKYDNYNSPSTYLIRLKDKEELKKSQSGGAFYAIATHFIEDGGIVFGAAFGDNWVVTHRKAESISNLENIRMSKYIQSDIRLCYKEVRQLLQSGRKILFSGTPCQVSALKSYIPKTLHTNLYCVDIICHGVPSPKIWKDYVSYIELKYKAKIIKPCFRDKRFGWHGAVESFMLDNGREIFRKTSNTLYFRHLSIRDSCSNCPYTNIKRVGDITVGDFWGLPHNSNYEDGLGVSLVLINSDKGQDLFRSISDVAVIEEKTIDECIQPQLLNPITLNANRDTFISDYKRKGFKYIIKKYSDVGYRYKLHNYYTLLKHKVKLIIAK